MGVPAVRSTPTSHLDPSVLVAIRDLMLAAFEGDFSDDDWDHTRGGRHFFVEENGAIVSHASVVPRVLEISGRPFRTGYVEGVATDRAHRDRGLGSAVVSAATSHIRENYELGGLGTELFDFYERLGWERWLGRTYVRRDGELFHTEEEDGFVMVLRFGPSRDVDLAASISCEARSGDDW